MIPASREIKNENIKLFNKLKSGKNHGIFVNFEVIAMETMNSPRAVIISSFKNCLRFKKNLNLNINI